MVMEERGRGRGMGRVYCKKHKFKVLLKYVSLLFWIRVIADWQETDIGREASPEWDETQDDVEL